MASFRIELPLPPPANSAYPTNWRTRRRYLSPRARAWKIEAGWTVRAANPPKMRGAFTFRILIPESAPGDADGRIKLAQDLMVELGVTPDDRLARASGAARDPAIRRGRCIVMVESA